MRVKDDLTGKNILVTGATGFIGSHLVERLQNDFSAHLILLSRQEVKPSKNLTPIQCSLNNLNPGIWAKHGVKQIEFVFHLGGFTPKNIADRNNLQAVLEDNVVGTYALLQSLPGSVEKILFASTLDCYKLPSENPIDESSPIHPASLYGASKYFSEFLVRNFAAQHQCPYAILRYGHIYGPGEEAYQRIIPLTIKRVLRNEPLVIHGDGSALRDFLHVDDAVEATLRAAFSRERRLDPLNIVSGTSISVKEVVRLIAESAHFLGEISYAADQAQGDSFRFDNRAMKEQLGSWPLVSLQEGLKREIEHARGFLRSDR